MKADAKAIKNEDGTFRLVNLNGDPFTYKIKLYDDKEIELKPKQDLLIWEMTDLQAYGVNIINLDELC